MVLGQLFLQTEDAVSELDIAQGDYRLTLVDGAWSPEEQARILERLGIFNARLKAR